MKSEFFCRLDFPFAMRGIWRELDFPGNDKNGNVQEKVLSNGYERLPIQKSGNLFDNLTAPLLNWSE